MSFSPQKAIVVAFGGNLGGPEEVVARFFDVVEKLSLMWGNSKVSGNYVSTPLGPVQDQPDFVNAVAAWWPEQMPTPEDSLARLQALEREHGRERVLIGGARTLDLDLLLHGKETRNSPSLWVPHPRMAQRAFVLRPLQELFGDDFQWHAEIPSVGTLLTQSDMAAQACAKLL